jgi:hypothetical protein
MTEINIKQKMEVYWDLTNSNGDVNGILIYLYNVGKTMSCLPPIFLEMVYT